MRPSQRLPDELRPVSLTRGVMPFAEGSCLVAFGHTRVLCSATVEESLPRWRRGQSDEGGWVSAEYGMLPRATKSRTTREAVTGKQGGRTVEIQRLIGRSLRSVTDLRLLGARTVWIDCDVLQADGGTRTAAITGAYVALAEACLHLQRQERIAASPLRDHVAAVSCGVVNGTPVLDLDYAEDSSCEADLNFVMTGAGGFVEIQGTGEKRPFTRSEFETLSTLAELGILQIIEAQKKVLSD